MSQPFNLTNDEVKAMYANMRLKAGPTETARRLGIPYATYYLQLQRATTKIEAAEPELKATIDGAVGDAALPATPVRKRKAKAAKVEDGDAKVEDGPTPKKGRKTKKDAAVKTEDDEVVAGVAMKTENADAVAGAAAESNEG